MKLITALRGERERERESNPKPPAPSFTKSSCHLCDGTIIAPVGVLLWSQLALARCKDKLTFTSNWVEGVLFFFSFSKGSGAAHGSGVKCLRQAQPESRGVLQVSQGFGPPTYTRLKSGPCHGAFGYRRPQGRRVGKTLIKQSNRDNSSPWQTVTHRTALCNTTAP